jgi:hypothetical protein
MLSTLLLFAIPALAANRFGPYYSLGPTNNRILYAETTLIPPLPPVPALDRLSIWVGIGTPSGARSQATLMSSPKVRGYAMSFSICFPFRTRPLHTSHEHGY